MDRETIRIDKALIEASAAEISMWYARIMKPHRGDFKPAQLVLRLFRSKCLSLRKSGLFDEQQEAHVCYLVFNIAAKFPSTWHKHACTRSYFRFEHFLKQINNSHVMLMSTGYRMD